MDTTGELIILFWITVAAVGVGGVAAGLLIYHCCLGWFISRSSKMTLENAVEKAEGHVRRRAERRHERTLRSAVLAEARSRPGGRHLAS